MFHFIRGIAVAKELDSVIIDNGGIGYRILTSAQTLSHVELDHETVIHTNLIVRENDMYLVGFISQSELRLFKLLTSVSGVGPKVALSILSVSDHASIALSIASSDTTIIGKASGVGKKTAERIVIDLKDRISKMGAADFIGQVPASKSSAGQIGIFNGDAHKEAVEALIVLGYSKREVEAVISNMDVTTKATDAIIVEALGRLGNK